MRSKALAAAVLGALLVVVLVAGMVSAGSGPPVLYGIRAEFPLFALTLLGVALFHERTLEVALTGLASLVILKLVTDPGFALAAHMGEQSAVLVNLFGLLLGFAVLSKHFEESQIPDILPRFLPDDWKGGFALLAIVFVLSSFLDNIAAAVIGGTIAKHVFSRRLDIGYLAAIVAASNAGGSGSVVGDTTTTMMWIEGIRVVDLLAAYVAALPAFLVFAILAAQRQQAYQPIQKDEIASAHVRWPRVAAVGLILVGAIAANILADFPALGVWIAIAVAATFTRTSFRIVLVSLRGALFLLSLVTAASLMPVEELPPASWQTTFGMGWISAIFDNIPLTKLALEQGGYDWGMLAFAVGFGGSMIWFGSSAGVALSSLFPEVRFTTRWVSRAWYVPLAYVAGLFTLLAVFGWNP